MKKMPEYLYHYSPKENRESIFKNGLIGSHNGEWCIYLAENPKSWKRSDWDCWKVFTMNLNYKDFTTADENLDEVLYWGRFNGKISITKENIKLEYI